MFKQELQHQLEAKHNKFMDWLNQSELSIKCKEKDGHRINEIN